MLAQLVEHCTSITEVMGSNSVQALFSLLLTYIVVFITVKITFKFNID